MSVATRNGKPRTARKKPDSVSAVVLSDAIEMVPLARLKPAQINGTVYKDVRLDDPATKELGKSIAANGLLEPFVVALDDTIVSGHRRRGGCRLARLKTVPIRRINITSNDPRFERYLVEYNRQRVKTPQEMMREEVARTSPDDARTALLAHRKIESVKACRRVCDSGLRVLNPKVAARRSRITDDKKPMLDAAIGVINKYEEYWPLTLRQVHYRLLTRYVLRNATRGYPATSG